MERKTNRIVHTLSVFAPFTFQSMEYEGKRGRRDMEGTIPKRQTKIMQEVKLTRKRGGGR